jgi:two-component system, OmpR family, response regulator
LAQALTVVENAHVLGLSGYCPAMTRLGRVLCIEDDPDVLTVLAFALSRHGADAVETARDGKSGIEKARSFRPDLVLCDLMMPGADGFEVLRQLRADPDLRAVPVIFLTAYAATAFRDADPQELGVAGVLVKPFRVQTLGQQIVDMLEGRAPNNGWRD